MKILFILVVLVKKIDISYFINLNRMNIEKIPSLEQLCLIKLANHGVTKEILIENSYPDFIAEMVGKMVGKLEKIISYISILEKIKSILIEIQEKPNFYKRNTYLNIRNADVKFRIIKSLIDEIDDNFIINFKIVITTFSKFGHRFDYSWRLVGVDKDKMIHESGIGYQNRSFCTKSKAGELISNLTTFDWNGDTPGRSLRNNENHWGYFSDNIIFLDNLISCIKAKFSIK